MNKGRMPLPFSLRAKLVISYLAVILGTILVLSLTFWFTINEYMVRAQFSSLRKEAEYLSKKVAYIYTNSGSRWNNLQLSSLPPNDLAMLIVRDSQGQNVVCQQPSLLADNCNNSSIQLALNQALTGHITEASLPITDTKADTSLYYVAVPVYLGNQIIGSMMLSEKQYSFADEFTRQINTAFILAGSGVTLVAGFGAFLLARRLTRPLIQLTNAADQVKHGKYAERVPSPKSQDELGRLALTFNEMADTIEADVNKLRHKEQELRAMLANIAHDLATPLTAIQGFSEALADDIIQDTQARQETALLIGREVQRLRRMVSDLQQTSSLETGQVRLDLAPLDIYTLVYETLAVIEPECNQAGVILRNEIPPGVPLVQADSDRITQVLLNLLDNSRRHTPVNGVISIGAKPKDNYLHVWVCDTGKGIDQNSLPRIFERFYRADPSRTGTTGGSGLGLSIVKAIITAHNGNVQANSKPGQGTCITFVLPLA